MAKRNASQRARSRKGARKRTPTRRLGKRPTAKTHLSRPASKGGMRGTKKSSARVAAKKGGRRTPARKVALPRQTVNRQGPIRRQVAEPVALGKRPKLDRARRALDETVPTPPSSLDMDRRASAVRTGRAEIHESQREHRGMSPEITAGDVDVDVEDAYFTGDEAPGGDNPTPDQDVVDDIGKALGVEYQDAEELKAGDKVVERDRHRWELDPASSEDYKDRK
jgi:uncharacterized protein DUF6335